MFRLLKEQGELLAEQAVRLKELENCKFDGHLLWKVQLQDAQGRKIANRFHSTSVYTGRPGYKMSFTLHLDESNAGSTALTAELNTGTYDDQLCFPFNGTCRVSVQDKANARSARKFEIPCVRLVPRPVNTNAHDQPCSANVDFIPMDELLSDSYLKDGALSINISVCTSTDFVDNFDNTLQIN